MLPTVVYKTLVLPTGQKLPSWGLAVPLGPSSSSIHTEGLYEGDCHG